MITKEELHDKRISMMTNDLAALTQINHEQ
jgi:hypothetical protein